MYQSICILTRHIWPKDKKKNLYRLPISLMKMTLSVVYDDVFHNGKMIITFLFGLFFRLTSFIRHKTAANKILIPLIRILLHFYKYTTNQDRLGLFHAFWLLCRKQYQKTRRSLPVMVLMELYFVFVNKKELMVKARSSLDENLMWFIIENQVY